jgi:hypothetical protein
MSLYFGVMMTWIGIESAFNFAGSGRVQTNEAAVTLSSAGPGLFFGLIGAVLITTSLYKTIEFRETRPVEEVSGAGEVGKIPAHKKLSNQIPSGVLTLTPEEQKMFPPTPDAPAKASVPMSMP